MGDNGPQSVIQSPAASSRAARSWDAALEEGFDENTSRMSKKNSSRQGEETGSEIELVRTIGA